MVANATPFTPKLKYIIKTISKIIFKIVDIIRKYKGFVESPRPLNIAQTELYPVEKKVPAKIIIKYPLDNSNISLGVFMILRIFSLKQTPIKVIKNEAININI